MTIIRPTPSEETILLAATKIATSVQGDADEIAECFSEQIDGYELAKKLEEVCSWDITVDMIERLDYMHYEVEKLHNKILKQWIIDSDIKPPFENGTKITRGVIDGIYEHKPAHFLVKEYDCTDESSRLIIKFEDAVAVEAEI